MGFALSNMQLTSEAFVTGGPIPPKYTGEGTDVSPPLGWNAVPQATASFVILCHDPDAPLVTSNQYGFVHWVLYNIGGSVGGLGEGSSDYTPGKNDFGNHAYGGPMPPEGHGNHHYFFWLMALDSALDLEPGLRMAELLPRIEPNVIAMNRLVGVYRRD